MNRDIINSIWWSFIQHKLVYDCLYIKSDQFIAASAPRCTVINIETITSDQHNLTKLGSKTDSSFHSK